MAPIATAASQGGPPVLAAGGRNDVRFTAAEIIDRGGGEIRRRIVSAAELADARREVQALLQLHDGTAGTACRPCARPAAYRGHRQRHARQLLRRRPPRQRRTPRSRTPCSSRPRAPTSSTSAASRPGPASDAVDLEEECRRVLPVIAALAKRSRARLSVDTRKAEVMRRAVARRRAHHQRRLGADARSAQPGGGRRLGLPVDPDARPGRSTHHAGQADL